MSASQTVYKYHLQTINQCMENILRYSQNFEHTKKLHNILEIGYQMSVLSRHMNDCTLPWTMESEYTEDCVDGVVFGICEYIDNLVS